MVQEKEHDTTMLCLAGHSEVTINASFDAVLEKLGLSTVDKAEA